MFNSFLFSKGSLNKKLLNIYLVGVDESDNCSEPSGTKLKMSAKSAIKSD